MGGTTFVENLYRRVINKKEKYNKGLYSKTLLKNDLFFHLKNRKITYKNYIFLVLEEAEAVVPVVLGVVEVVVVVANKQVVDDNLQELEQG